MALRRSLMHLQQELLVTLDYHGKGFFKNVNGEKWKMERSDAAPFHEELKKMRNVHVQTLSDFSGRVLDLDLLFPKHAMECETAMVRKRKDCQVKVEEFTGTLDQEGWNQLFLKALQAKGGVASDVFNLRRTDFMHPDAKPLALVHVDDDGNPTIHLGSIASFDAMRPIGGAWHFVKEFESQQAGDEWLHAVSLKTKPPAVKGIFAEDGKPAGWEAAVAKADELMQGEEWLARRARAVEAFQKATGLETVPDDAMRPVYALLDDAGKVVYVGDSRRVVRERLLMHVKHAACTAGELVHTPTELAAAHCERGEPFFHVVLADERQFRARKDLLRALTEKLKPRFAAPGADAAKAAVRFYRKM